jgi:hypothetical protein
MARALPLEVVVPKSIGLVVVDASRLTNDRSVTHAVFRGIQATPEGRHLAVLIDLPRSWEAGRNIEAAVCAQILTRPEARSDGDEWEYFGTIVVRMCGSTGSDRDVEREVGVVVCRRHGPKPYERRWEMSSQRADAARLDVLHPVFTRDVANNVWHLWGDDPSDEIVRRMAHLLTWPDEETLVIAHRSSRRINRRSARLERALIGVPSKRTYAWRGAQLELVYGSPTRTSRRSAS